MNKFPTPTDAKSDAYRAAPGLHLISTPIGRARDITLHALDVLSSADLLVAEDTRVLRKLLSLHNVPVGSRRVLSHHDHSTKEQLSDIRAALMAGQSVAYTSDAGTPMISDPGFDLVRIATEVEAQIHAAPGASAFLSALVVSGLPASKVLFAGFLPQKTVARKAAFKEIEYAPWTTVYYENPKRIVACLGDAVDVFDPSREIVLARELTKRHEQVVRGPVAALLRDLTQHAYEFPEKGELVMLVAPAAEEEISDDLIHQTLIDIGLDEGVKNASKLVAGQLNVSRKRVYDIALKLRKA